jgi:putative transcriptional regulator
MDKANGHIRNNIRTLRFHHHEMTQQELAARVGVTRQTILAIEQGKYSPSLEVAFRIALVFGVPFAEVFWYELEDDTANPPVAPD